jgi:type 1 glutamine amidotransferase
MAKAASNKKRKAQAAANQPTKKPATAATAVDVSNSDIDQASKPTTTDDNLIAGLVFPEELEATIEVLRTLAENPAALRSSKDLKGFKGAMWDCWRGLQEASGTGTYLIMFKVQIQKLKSYLSARHRRIPHVQNLGRAPRLASP